MVFLVAEADTSVPTKVLRFNQKYDIMSAARYKTYFRLKLRIFKNF